MTMRPRVAWVLGDPAGTGPEIVAKSLASPEMRAVMTPAHGTAFDIVRKRVASPAASPAAMRLAARMAGGDAR